MSQVSTQRSDQHHADNDPSAPHTEPKASLCRARYAKIQLIRPIATVAHGGSIGRTSRRVKNTTTKKAMARCRDTASLQIQMAVGLALTRFKLTLRLIDDVNAATTAHQPVVTVTGQQRLQ